MPDTCGRRGPMVTEDPRCPWDYYTGQPKSGACGKVELGAKRGAGGTEAEETSDLTLEDPQAPVGKEQGHQLWGGSRLGVSRAEGP